MDRFYLWILKNDNDNGFHEWQTREYIFEKHHAIVIIVLFVATKIFADYQNWRFFVVCHAIEPETSSRNV